MTDVPGKGVTLEELANRYPHLYHMAEAGTWELIRAQGLRSTTALLDLFEYSGETRNAIEIKHRPKSVTITHAKYGQAVIRDQRPMSDARLRNCLTGATPEEWYKLLNGKVFFWTSELRFKTLLKSYAENKQLMLKVDTASILKAHRNAVTLCPMNSGATRPYAHPRSPSVFQPLESYPYEERESRHLEPVVEFCVSYSVGDIADHIVSAVHVQATDSAYDIVETLFTRKSP